MNFLKKLFGKKQSDTGKISKTVEKKQSDTGKMSKTEGDVMDSTAFVAKFIISVKFQDSDRLKTLLESPVLCDECHQVVAQAVQAFKKDNSFCCPNCGEFWVKKGAEPGGHHVSI